VPGTTLRAIHTPGHASNHLCYLLEEEKTLFTGDHVMQMSTVVINPPDGDMRAYIESLRSLLGLDLDWLAPGHGFLMAGPRQAMEKVIAHRLGREAKVVDALRALGPRPPGRCSSASTPTCRQAAPDGAALAHRAPAEAARRRRRQRARRSVALR
jgi:glyoxylase-like metal-dependent hydrolase (beta-lactamase superfamily II)